MYSLTFSKTTELGDLSSNISCVNYSVLNRKSGGFTITTYKDHTDVNGVERHLNDENYTNCFVSMAGKTINKYTYKCAAGYTDGSITGVPLSMP